MKTFKIFDKLDSDKPILNVPFGTRISYDEFGKLLKLSRNIRDGHHKEWNKWCSDSFSRIIEFKDLRTPLNLDLIRKRIDYLSKKNPTAGINSANRIIFVTPTNASNSFIQRNLSTFISKFSNLELLEVYNHFDTPGITDLHFLVSNSMMKFLYEHIMKGNDGKIYHRIYPISTWVFVLRMPSLELYSRWQNAILNPKNAVGPSIDGLSFPSYDYDEKIERISLFSKIK